MMTVKRSLSYALGCAAFLAANFIWLRSPTNKSFFELLASIGISLFFLICLLRCISTNYIVLRSDSLVINDIFFSRKISIEDIMSVSKTKKNSLFSENIIEVLAYNNSRYKIYSSAMQKDEIQILYIELEKLIDLRLKK
ncbi:MAG: hypothetical protein J0I41_05010 [Filimonas sp.]|nr:hypothetical protein [Filimonas sp.]